MEKILTWLLGPDGFAIVGGAAGGIVAALSHNGHSWDRFRLFAVGILSCYFASPIVVPGLEWILGFVLPSIDPIRVAGMAGYIVGAFGVFFVEVIRIALLKRLGLTVKEVREYTEEKRQSEIHNREEES